MTAADEVFLIYDIEKEYTDGRYIRAEPCESCGTPVTRWLRSWNDGEGIVRQGWWAVAPCLWYPYATEHTVTLTAHTPRICRSTRDLFADLEEAS